MMTTDTRSRFTLRPLVGTQHRPSSKKFRVRRQKLARRPLHDDGTPELVAHRLRLAAGNPPTATCSPLEMLLARSRRDPEGQLVNRWWEWPITEDQARAAGAYAWARSVYLGRATRTALAYAYTTASPPDADPPAEITATDVEQRAIEARDYYRRASSRLMHAGPGVFEVTHDVVILEIWPAPILTGGAWNDAERQRMAALLRGLETLRRAETRRKN